MSDGVQLLVIAKAPAPGASKTRLSPPCTPKQAAAIAEAALRDTLAAVAAVPAARRVLVLDGEPGAWMHERFDVIPQRGDGLDERLASAFEDASPGPALLVGMDTPQLEPEMLAAATALLVGNGSDAVIGEALDGGYWAIGLRESNRRVFEGVPMSRDDTAAHQRERLRHLGFQWDELPLLQDVDVMADAAQVAAQVPRSRFAAAVDAVMREIDQGRGTEPGGDGP